MGIGPSRCRRGQGRKMWCAQLSTTQPSNNIIWILGLWKGLTITYLMRFTYYLLAHPRGGGANSATLVRENFSEVIFEPRRHGCLHLFE